MKGKAAKGALSLQGDLDVFAIRAQWEGLCASLPPEGDVTLDLSGLGDVDLSGFQLLASAQRKVREGGGRLHLTGLPPEVAERLRGLGFHELLGEVPA